MRLFIFDKNYKVNLSKGSLIKLVYQNFATNGSKYETIKMARLLKYKIVTNLIFKLGVYFEEIIWLKVIQIFKIYITKYI